MQRMRLYLSSAGLEALGQYDVKVIPVGDVSMESFQEAFTPLVPKLKVGFLSPLGLESQQMDEEAQDNGNMNVYVVNPRQTGFAATAAMTVAALRNPETTVVTVVENPNEPFSEEEKAEVAQVKGIFEALGAKVFDDVEKMSGYVNAEVAGEEPVEDAPKDQNDDLDKGDPSADGDDETPPDSGAGDDTGGDDDAGGDDTGGGDEDTPPANDDEGKGSDSEEEEEEGGKDTGSGDEDDDKKKSEEEEEDDSSDDKDKKDEDEE